MENHKLNSIALLIFFFFFCGFINAHSGYHSESHAKSWQLSENNKTFKADYIALIKDIVLLKDPKTGVVYEYPLTDFVMEDQFLILKRHELTAHINANLALPIPVKKGTSGLKMTKGNVNISLICYYFWWPL